jgi:hypothetical protein
MGIYIEAIILYILLFFSGSVTQMAGSAASANVAGFSAISGIIRLILYTIPSIALIWCIILRTWKIEYWIIRPGRKDITCGLIVLPCLLIIGFIISFISLYVDGSQAQTLLHSPSTVLEWAVIGLTCIFAAYLEESYFRFYLLSKRKELNMSNASALFFSTALFSICHIYAGPWGFINAAVCGAFLGFMFLRYNSFHGIAIAHGIYNIMAYVIYSLMN